MKYRVNIYISNDEICTFCYPSLVGGPLDPTCINYMIYIELCDHEG